MSQANDSSIPVSYENFDFQNVPPTNGRNYGEKNTSFYYHREAMSELNEDPIVYDRSNSRYAPKEGRTEQSERASYDGARREQYDRRTSREQGPYYGNNDGHSQQRDNRNNYGNDYDKRAEEYRGNERREYNRRDDQRRGGDYRGADRREAERRNGDRRHYQNNDNNGYSQQRDNRNGYSNNGNYQNGHHNGYGNGDYRSNTNNRNRGGYRQNNGDYQNGHGNGGGYRQEDYRNENGSYHNSNANQRGGSYSNEGAYQNRNYRGRSYGEQIEPTIGARGKKGEPISLAEELALEKSRGMQEPNYDECYEQLRQMGDETYLVELEKMSTQELVTESRRQDMATDEGTERQELIFRLLKARIKKNGLMYGEGTLEILPDEFGFLRSSDYHYLSCPDDIYVSPSQIRRFGLRNGSIVSGQIRPPKENERYFALLRVEAINHEDPNKLSSKPFFDDLTPIHPDERIIMEDPDGDMNTRVVDLTVPVGFGQRGLIVSPPRAGKTILMQKMAKAALANYPNLHVFMLLVDERPEEVTDMERQIKGPRCEVISSTFDEAPSRHIQVSEMVLDKAKRMVEYGKDVIIFLDSMTRLARAWNAECPTSGRTLSGGVDANALQRPKRFFGSARKVEEGGSLTIIATALVDTGSRMDDVIFEEFKGTGNLEIVLDRSLVDKRIWPAINIGRSGTRREEMLMDPEEYRRISILRRVLSEQNPTDSMEFLVKRLAKTKSNGEFLMGLNIQ